MNREGRARMRMKGLPKVRLWLLTGLLLSACLFASSCTFFIGVPSDLLPLPDGVSLLDLPQILSCAVTPIRGTCEALYERVCGWYYWTEPWVQTPSTGWIYTCRDVFVGRDCTYDITIRLTVSDPSNDLRSSQSPRVRVFDSDPVEDNGAYRTCLLDIPQTDIAIQSTDIEATGVTKTITVRLRDIRARFTSSCRTLAAVLRSAIVFESGGEDLTSSNTWKATMELDRLTTYLY